MVLFHLHGGNLSEGTTLTYFHRPEASDFPPYKHWPAIYSPSYSSLKRSIAYFGREIPGADIILFKGFVDSLRLEAPRLDEPVVLLFGVHCIRPAENLVRGITEEDFRQIVVASEETHLLKRAASIYCQLVGLSATRREHKKARRVLFPQSPSRASTVPVTPSPKRSTDAICNVPTYRDASYEISKALFEFTRPRGCHLTKFLLLKGVPGCGKTTAVSTCVEELVERPLWETFGIQVKLICLNCAANNSPSAVAPLIREACSVNDDTKLEDISCLVGSGKNRTVLIVVLDEIDFWVNTECDSEHARLHDTEKTVRDLVRLASDPARRLCLVGISNAMSGVVDARLQHVLGGRVSQESVKMHFPPIIAHICFPPGILLSLHASLQSHRPYRNYEDPSPRTIPFSEGRCPHLHW